jgi:hypothetical protein
MTLCVIHFDFGIDEDHLMEWADEDRADKEQRIRERFEREENWHGDRL